ncbi:hypothetical protein YC2023_075943 [Brassica napus]
MYMCQSKLSVHVDFIKVVCKHYSYKKNTTLSWIIRLEPKTKQKTSFDFRVLEDYIQNAIVLLCQTFTRRFLNRRRRYAVITRWSFVGLVEIPREMSLQLPKTVLVAQSALGYISELIANQTVLRKTGKKRMEVMSLTAPSSQRKFTGCFLSAPTSPRRITEWYREYEEEAKRNFSEHSLIPFDWEENQGSPRKITDNEEDTVDDK